ENLTCRRDRWRRPPAAERRGQPLLQLLQPRPQGRPHRLAPPRRPIFSQPPLEARPEHWPRSSSLERKMTVTTLGHRSAWPPVRHCRTHGGHAKSRPPSYKTKKLLRARRIAAEELNVAPDYSRPR